VIVTSISRKSHNIQTQFEECEPSRNTFRPEPLLIYEKKRRRIRTTVQNMWDNFLYHVDTIEVENKNEKVSSLIQTLVDSIYEHKMYV
jgi:hypothetical protein